MISAFGLIAVSLLVLGVLTFAVLRHLPHSRTLSGIFLRESTSRETGYLSAPARADLVGSVGVALTDLRPSGTVRVGEERIDVVTEGPWIEEGARVVVLRAESYRHIVREAAAEELASETGETEVPEERHEDD